MRYVQIESTNTIEQRRNDYLHTLVAPMDGMWESAVIAHATFWDIRDQEQYAGYFCIDSNNYLLRFHLLEIYQAQAQELFRRIISTHNIQYAITSTIEPMYLSLCLDLQKNIELHSYLFRDSKRIEPSFGLSNGIFRKAEKRDLGDITHFYQTNTEGPRDWIEAFLDERTKRAELFVLYDGQILVASGECIPSERQTPHADLGIVVAQAYRGRGLGSSMLMQLKQHCYKAGLQPICSCAADNHASKKAIEKAGFVSEHRMIKVLFSNIEI